MVSAWEVCQAFEPGEDIQNFLDIIFRFHMLKYLWSNWFRVPGFLDRLDVTLFRGKDDHLGLGTFYHIVLWPARLGPMKGIQMDLANYLSIYV